MQKIGVEERLRNDVLAPLARIDDADCLLPIDDTSRHDDDEVIDLRRFVVYETTDWPIGRDLVVYIGEPKRVLDLLAAMI